MRLCLLFALAWLGLFAVSADAQQSFPYKAHVVADDVYVRSGPGKDYYPTSKVKSGEAVEIYRHDPGGWYAIRPPEGEFEWISGRYLNLGRDNLAEVTGDRVAARVGSQFSDVRDVIQVRLHEGELVEILESTRVGSGPDSGTWYKIAPPSGAFRWIHGKYVDPSSSGAGIRQVSSRPNPLTDPTSSRPTPAARPTVPAPAAEENPQRVGQWAPATTNDPAVYTNKFDDPAHHPEGQATMRRIAPEEFQDVLDEINLDLSVMLVEEPSVWSFHELDVRARSLLTQAETAVERGRVRSLLRRIELSQDVKTRYQAVNRMEAQIDRHTRQLSALDSRRKQPSTAEAPADRYDGSGKLRRVVSQKVGAPQYALVDEAGNVRCFVTPAPGVNMQYYLGRRIGVSGIRGYIPDRGAQHVTAKHVTALEDTPVLR